jgi:hypothetical protein
LITKERRNVERNTRTKTCEEKEQTHADMGNSPKERYTFPLMSKGERERNNDEEKQSQGEHDSWSMSVSINVGVAINSKGGYCWTIGFHLCQPLEH